jgi:hypothetical protein
VLVSYVDEERGEEGVKKMEKHFVTFLSPGTFVNEETTKPIKSWDVALARKMAEEITERYNSKPFAFQFSTRVRGEKDLDSKVVKESGRYYINGKVETLADVEARNDPKEDILRSNMRNNGIKKVVSGNSPWRWTHELHDGDVVL